MRYLPSARVVLAFVLVLGFVSTARAGAPTDQLKAHIDHVLTVLQNPALKGVEHKAQRQAPIREVMDAGIDFTAMSRRALGAAWAARTPAERAEFVSAFGDFLTTAYLAQIDLYHGETVLYDGERVTGEQATVLTHSAREGGDPTQLEFRLQRNGDGHWLAYDVIVDGVSMLDSYRVQFRAVLRRGSFEDLVKQLKARQSK
jgi:phospholipid transport system substrate-binding protein